MKLPNLQIPRAFTTHRNIKEILCATVEEFGYEEQCAIHYYHLMDLSMRDIAHAVQLTEGHVTSTIELFAARLHMKLEFFMAVQPHDKNDYIPVCDILLAWDL